MKRIIFCLVLMVCLVAGLSSAENSWGHLKKIYFYDSLKNFEKVAENLEQISFEGMPRDDRQAVASRLINFGDYYQEQGQYQLARSFYERVLEISPDYWFVVNRLERIQREEGDRLLGVSSVWRQFRLLLKDFEASFFLFNTLFNVIFFAGLFVFFLIAVILFIKYFRLAANDLMLDPENHLYMRNVIIFILLLIWPLVGLSGWMVYPFLIVGMLWIYITDHERKSVLFILILLLLFAFLYGINTVVERNFKSEDFRTVKNVFNGRRYDGDRIASFDNHLKVYQALSFYENGDFAAAEDILNSTGEAYNNRIKFNLLGNIYYKSDNVSQSIKFFQKALSLDDRDEIALNNFTMALIKNDNVEVFESWAKRYPEIKEYQKQILNIREVKRNDKFLWSRLFNPAGGAFQLGAFLKSVIGAFFSQPFFYAVLVMLLYIALVRRLFPGLGGSTYCSKCSQIIKESSVHRSYKLCNECYQLFLIKDVIFLEAKILKEKELEKRSQFKYIMMLIGSVFIPGLILNFNRKNKRFILLSGFFFIALFFYIFARIVMQKTFMTAPLFLSAVGLIAVLTYLGLNVYSLLGDRDGI